MVYELTEPDNRVALLGLVKYSVIVLWSVDISGTGFVGNIITFIR